MTQVLKEGRALHGWSGERAIPGRGVAVGTPVPVVSREERHRLSWNGCVRSPELRGQQNKRHHPGKERSPPVVPDLMSRKNKTSTRQRLGSNLSALLPSPRLSHHVGLGKAQGLPNQSDQVSRQGSPTDQPCDLRRVTAALPVSFLSNGYRSSYFAGLLRGLD